MYREVKGSTSSISDPSSPAPSLHDEPTKVKARSKQSKHPNVTAHYSAATERSKQVTLDPTHVKYTHDQYNVKQRRSGHLGCMCATPHTLSPRMHLRLLPSVARSHNGHTPLASAHFGNCHRIHSTALMPILLCELPSS